MFLLRFSVIVNKKYALNFNYQIEGIYHLAAILSTKAEKNPTLAKQVNINGTTNIYGTSGWHHVAFQRWRNFRARFT